MKLYSRRTIAKVENESIVLYDIIDTQAYATSHHIFYYCTVLYACNRINTKWSSACVRHTSFTHPSPVRERKFHDFFDEKLVFIMGDVVICTFSPFSVLWTGKARNYQRSPRRMRKRHSMHLQISLPKRFREATPKKNIAFFFSFNFFEHIGTETHYCIPWSIWFQSLCFYYHEGSQ